MGVKNIIIWMNIIIRLIEYRIKILKDQENRFAIIGIV